MIWIYGGGFTLGTSETIIYNGAQIVNNHDVVVVSFNYRINVFGFPGAPGLPSKEKNPGLRDVRAAVEWVKRNIGAYGGDASKITLFGESAGAAAVDAYLYAYASNPIIRGAIAQSGDVSIATSGGLGNTTDPAATWGALATAVGCPATGLLSLPCVRTKPATALRDALFANPTLAFIPWVDEGTIFSNTPQRLASGQFARIPFLGGSNDNEIPGTTPAAIIGTKLAFTCPAARTAKGRTAYVPTWQYRYYGNFPTAAGVPPAGAFHGSEITQIFQTFNPLIATPQQIASSIYIQNAWVTFVKNPTSGLSSLGWPKFDPTKPTLVQLAVNNANTPSYADPAPIQGDCYA